MAFLGVKTLMKMPSVTAKALTNLLRCHCQLLKPFQVIINTGNVNLIEN